MMLAGLRVFTKPMHLKLTTTKIPFSMTSRSNRVARNKLNAIFAEGESVSSKAGQTFRLAAIGSSAVGVGIIAWYGTRMSFEAKPIDRALIWPQFVRDRVKNTYGYFCASVAMAAGTALAVLRNPTLFRFVAQPGWMPAIIGMAAVMGSGIVCRALPYPESGFSTKHLAWMAHNASLGLFLSPICLMGGPILMRAAVYTLGIVGGLSTVAMCSPSDKFLTMGGPLAMGLGVVFVANLASLFVSPVGVAGAGLYGIVTYGGLVLFSGFLLYDTQSVVRRAETHNQFVYGQFDPINNSMGIFMDSVNIFVRLVMILSGNRKR